MQTAVEWLYDQMIIAENVDYKALLKQAKEMEKQQIIISFNDGAINPKNWGIDYYNETYGNKVNNEIGTMTPENHVEVLCKAINSEKQNVLSSQTEISDEEIDKIARELANIPHNRPFDDAEKDYKDYQKYEGIVVGLKWCRGKLKSNKTELYEEDTEVFGCCNMKECICSTEQEMNVEISDEEIHKAGIELSKQGKDLDYRWIEGAKWYREQLKSRQ